MAVGVDLEKRLEDVIGLEPIKDKLRSLKDTLVKESPTPQLVYHSHLLFPST